MHDAATLVTNSSVRELGFYTFSNVGPSRATIP
jgi:hypothetical protein